MAERMITVEVAYLDVDHQYRQSVEVAEGSTVLEAIIASGVAKHMPDATWGLNPSGSKLDPSRVDPNRLGIFSKRVSVDHVVESADRIEIYRPLILDPMEARRRRAR